MRTDKTLHQEPTSLPIEPQPPIDAWAFGDGDDETALDLIVCPSPTFDAWEFVWEYEPSLHDLSSALDNSGPCPQRALVMSDNTTANRVSIVPPCDRRLCPEHGIKNRHVRVAAYVLQLATWPLVAISEVPATMRDTFNTRARRAGAITLRFTFTDGCSLVLSNLRLPCASRDGISSVSSTVADSSHVCLVLDALLVRGDVSEIRASWQRTKDERRPSGQRHRLAAANADERRAAEAMMRVIYAADGGTSWPQHAANPTDLAVYECDDLFLRALDAVRAEHLDRRPGER